MIILIKDHRPCLKKVHREKIPSIDSDLSYRISSSLSYVSSYPNKLHSMIPYMNKFEQIDGLIID
jgi:hypothetical protein